MIHPIHFYDEPIEVEYHQLPVFAKTPTCPDAFLWREERFVVEELLEEWHNFSRRGRMRQNMQPAHAERASVRGSWGVGRFHFRLRVTGGRIFELYYDRAPQDADDRKGHWLLYSEWGDLD